MTTITKSCRLCGATSYTIRFEHIDKAVTIIVGLDVIVRVLDWIFRVGGR